VACVGEIQVNVNRYPNHIFLDQKGVEYSIALGERKRLFGWHILAYLGLSWLIFSHKILFILPAEHYSFCKPNTLRERDWIV
jgi:hypothetical protein